ncbi:FtsX-like permease family protein [Cellulomonas wangsupingiae]|uniref:ABC3 transporter permease C-terminal domain-containing protein n=1 Tax=Cellulomonas wangsupingiae TaxID=2968085 RepID=A0ABY5K6K8_9CELL|nr:FtsX-like permease family protein [Cellulomonas wangsupingiae]MCC2334409.1 hypothetical protein [Cellulomonas wangsupingiae]UUI66076.1 hypothetical protein NP075_04940 [Cellulomonas wangsupingiae]
MGWRSQVLLGRLRDQAAVLATVTLVTFVATTLLGTFAFLLDVTGHDAVDAALDRLPDSAVTLEANIRVRNDDTQAAVAAAEATFAETLGDLPSERSLWLTGRLWTLPREDARRAPPLGYPASSPLVPGQADLLSGAWPDAARDDAGRLQVNVPDVAAQRYGWPLGTEIPVRTLSGGTPDTWVVVGTHRLTGPASSWSRDVLDGAGHSDAFPVPGTSGTVVTDAWGPMVVAPEALLGPDVTESARLLVTPDLAGAPRGALAATRDALESGQVRLSRALGALDISGFVQTRLDATIDAASREQTVTQVGVVVVGLLLAVLATTVMLLAARLLSERRAAEGALVAARGASPAQLRSLAVVEAVVVAGVTAAVSPWAARALFVHVVDRGGLAAAGLTTPEGVPAAVGLACAAVAVVLAVALVVPAWHTSGSSSSAAHAGLVRTGADLALVALAGVALWQLVDYGAPLTPAAGGPRLDPVLVAGPALVVLGAAVLALRLVGPVARVADVLARSSRTLVAPLAAWQVSRRTSAATGTTLVVVLAVTAATFSHAFHATWRTSQLEQVDLALGADARIDDLRGDPLTSSADVRAALADAPAGSRAQPVVDRQAVVGANLGPASGSNGIDTRLLAVDAGDTAALRGRSEPTWSALLGGLVASDAPRATGVRLPGDPQWLVATVTPGTAPAASGAVYLRLAVEDDAGVQAWLGRLDVPLAGPSSLALEVPRSLGPLRVVAVSAAVLLDDAPPEVRLATTGRDRVGHVGLALHDVRVVDRAEGVTSALVAELVADAQGTPVDLGSADWAPTSHLGSSYTVVAGRDATTPDPASLPADALVLDATFDMTSIVTSSGLMSAQTWPATGPLRAVLTPGLAERAGLDPGDGFWLRVENTPVPARVHDVAPYLPGTPRGHAVLVDRTALSRAVAEAAGSDTLVDSWWVTAPDAAAPALASAVALSTDAGATVRVTERESAVSGPLRVAVPAALSLVTAAAGVLLLVGLGASAAAAVRSRRLELARLQALGAARRSLVGGLVAEHAFLVALGTGAGLVIGYGLARAVAPLLTVSPDGLRPVPSPLTVWDDGVVLALTGGLAVAGCALVAVLAALLVRRASGALLRLGDDR